MKAGLTVMGTVVWLCLPAVAQADDQRRLVAMPDAVHRSLQQVMQGHMTVLDTILSAIANERFDQAARMADERLRIGPLDPEAEAALPPAMRDARSSFEESGKRLAAAARKTNADRSYFRMRRLTAAISEVTATCNMCHAHFRIR